MQFTSGPYYTPMDRESREPPREEPRLEKPIVPINELGITVVEKDPVTGGNIIQNVDSAIRQGASKLQLVFNQSHLGAMGGRPKAYGKDVREGIRELTRVNDVMIEGVEMPTASMSNLSGFDPQRGNISEQRRHQDLQEVKDAIKFLGDVAGGGGVDIWSQEFQRNIVDAPWNMKDSKWKGAFEHYEKEDKYATEYLVDTRTGQVMSEIRHSSDIYEPVYAEAQQDKWGVDRKGNKVQIKKGDWVDIDGRWIDPTEKEDLLHRVPAWDAENKKFKTRRVEWGEVLDRTSNFNQRYSGKIGYELDPAEYAFRLQLENKWIQARGHSLFYTREYEDELKQLKSLKESLDYYKKVESSVPEDEQWKILHEDRALRHALGGEFIPPTYKKPTEIIQHSIDKLTHHLKHVHEASAAADAQADEVIRTMDQVKSIKKYAKEKAVDSYAEAGLAALDETRLNRNVERPIHVGPEIGWPTGYGGHPEEFIELIKESRKKMAERLVKERGVGKSEAKEIADKHIKGCFDTSHMGMWLQHFKKAHPQETEEQRMGRFKNWYMEMVAKMQKEGVIGSVQAVDSASAAHGHLPAGQGIFPVIEAVDFLKSHGFTGAIISEGHEEEQFQRGRILLQTWRAFGAEIADSYFAPAPAAARWSDVADSYFGHVNPPPYIIGQYRPTDDWVFWSGVPLE
ncbi:sugar phosphate isomerase/epimerase [Candidatus Woesearchaeota archaeon]|nr:sugar phosphate isomerase/epimerase [Candidatus Woesearchaeota archaeon]